MACVAKWLVGVWCDVESSTAPHHASLVCTVMVVASHLHHTNPCTAHRLCRARVGVVHCWCTMCGTVLLVTSISTHHTIHHASRVCSMVWCCWWSTHEYCRQLCMCGASHHHQPLHFSTVAWCVVTSCFTCVYCGGWCAAGLIASGFSTADVLCSVSCLCR